MAEPKRRKVSRGQGCVALSSAPVSCPHLLTVNKKGCLKGTASSELRRSCTRLDLLKDLLPKHRGVQTQPQRKPEPAHIEILWKQKKDLQVSAFAVFAEQLHFPVNKRQINKMKQTDHQQPAQSTEAADEFRIDSHEESQGWTQPSHNHLESSVSSRFSLLFGTDSHLLHSLLTSKTQKVVLEVFYSTQNQSSEKHPRALKCLSHTHQLYLVSNKIPGWKPCR